MKRAHRLSNLPHRWDAVYGRRYAPYEVRQMLQRLRVKVTGRQRLGLINIRRDLQRKDSGWGTKAEYWRSIKHPGWWWANQYWIGKGGTNRKQALKAKLAYLRKTNSRRRNRWATSPLPLTKR